VVDDKAPQQGSSGNAKYVLIGLLLLGGAVGLYLVATSEPPPAPAPAPPPPAEIARVNPMAQPTLVLEDDTPDAGKPVEAAPPPKKKGPAGPRAGDWECSGDLPSALQVINANRTQVRSCYERRLKVNNILQGDLTLRLKVGSTGKVSATQVGGSLGDKETFECVKKLASTWTFDVPAGGACAVVQVPFRFSPKNP
jgi:hypothetical protein